MEFPCGLFYGHQDWKAVDCWIDHSPFLQTCVLTNDLGYARHTAIPVNELAPMRKTLLENLVVSQPINNCPAVYGARMFINVLPLL
jgi:hypothetical protein